MITAIEIQNFKAIGLERQRIELKPITLLFGPNSAGKSTIIHALHYVREILTRGNVDAGFTQSGGESIDLGGFRTFVYGQRRDDSTIRIRVEFTIPEKGLLLEYLEDEQGFLTVGERVKQAWVEVAIRWSGLLGRPYVFTYSVGLNGVQFAVIDHYPDRKTTELIELNRVHPILAWPASAEAEGEISRRIEQGYARHRDDCENLWEALIAEFSSPPNFDKAVALVGQSSAIPISGQPLNIAWSPPTDAYADPSEAGADASSMRDLQAFLSQLIVGPMEMLLRELENFRYLGPIRQIPPRDYQPHHYPDIARWPSGLAAWDALAVGTEDFLKDVSEWLSSDEYLATDYIVSQQRQRLLKSDSPLMIALETGRVFDDFDADQLRNAFRALPESVIVSLVDSHGIRLLPPDVGVGISQVVPVIVAVLATGAGIVAIEQPELHLHPKQQAALGDLLITAALWKPKHTLIIETHSEHVVLRLLKRIRQAAQKELPSGQLEITPDSLAVHYVEPTDMGVRVKPLRMNSDGEFIDQWPQGFFDERAEELFG